MGSPGLGPPRIMASVTYLEDKEGLECLDDEHYMEGRHVHFRDILPIRQKACLPTKTPPRNNRG